MSIPSSKKPQAATRTRAQHHPAGWCCTLVVVAIGGIVEIAPLFYLDNTIEEVEGVRPYSPLEQAGRDIYIREGCYGCHSQMIRPFRDETERYGHYSLAAESMYDHPFQWGSKRTGPDLARVGGRYSDEWHVQHLIDPQSWCRKASCRKPFFLERPNSTGRSRSDHGRAHALSACPTPTKRSRMPRPICSRRPIPTRFRRRPRGALSEGADPRFRRRIPDKLTEMDALIAYLQMLGTLVDFDSAAPLEELAEEKGDEQPTKPFATSPTAMRWSLMLALFLPLCGVGRSGRDQRTTTATPA